ncbi:MAG: hypothetical protein U0414_33260 [Polyangiaceae bacterium]
MPTIDPLEPGAKLDDDELDSNFFEAQELLRMDRAISGALPAEFPKTPRSYWRSYAGGRVLDGGCGVWDVRTRSKIFEVTEPVSAGGGQHECVRLSPRGSLVMAADGRFQRWFRLDAGNYTACESAAVSPDDRSCISNDAPALVFEEGDPFDVRWCTTAVEGKERCRSIVKVTLGANHLRGFSVQYCSDELAIVDTREEHIAVDAATGARISTVRRIGGRPSGCAAGKSAKHPR